LTAVTEPGVKSAGTAEPALGYGVGAAGLTVGTADDGGDASPALDEATGGDDTAPGDSLAGIINGSGIPVGVVDVDGVRLLAVAVDPWPPEPKPMAPATTAITATAPSTAPPERRC